MSVSNAMMRMRCDPVLGIVVDVWYSTSHTMDYLIANSVATDYTAPIGAFSLPVTDSHGDTLNVPTFPNCDDKQWLDVANNRFIQVGGCGPGIPPQFALNPSTPYTTPGLVFTTPGLFVVEVPLWATGALVICWGSGADGTDFTGGGGGACAVVKFVALTPGSTRPGFIADHNSTDATTFTGDSQTISADYANGGTGGQAANSSGDLVFSGGNSPANGGGSSAGPLANGVNGSGITGGVGPPGSGKGGNDTIKCALPGGGGGYSANGAAGMVAILFLPCKPNAVQVQGAVPGAIAATA